MSTIAIEQMEFYAYHGCFKEEQIIGTKFLVDLYLESDTAEAEKTDDLTKTINYQEVYLLVKKEMDAKSKLLEHAGRRILDVVMQRFPEISRSRLKIAKMNPPLGGRVNSVSLTLTAGEG